MFLLDWKDLLSSTHDRVALPVSGCKDRAAGAGGFRAVCTVLVAIEVGWRLARAWIYRVGPAIGLVREFLRVDYSNAR